MNWFFQEQSSQARRILTSALEAAEAQKENLTRQLSHVNSTLEDMRAKSSHLQELHDATQWQLRQAVSAHHELEVSSQGIISTVRTHVATCSFQGNVCDSAYRPLHQGFLLKGERMVLRRFHKA